VKDMKLNKLIYKRKISIIGVCIFLIVYTATLMYKIIKWIILKTINMTKWFIRYIRFIHSGYSYHEIYDIILSLNGSEFEKFCFELLKASGFNCRLTPPTNDYGRDIIITTKDGEIFVEAKHYTGNNSVVGREICQKLLGSMQQFNAVSGIVITTGKIHNNAWECASMVDNLELWDMADIMKLVAKVDQRKLPMILTKTLGSNSKIVRLNPVRN
jgi:restriction system protein